MNPCNGNAAGAFKCTHSSLSGTIALLRSTADLVDRFALGSYQRVLHDPNDCTTADTEPCKERCQVPYQALLCTVRFRLGQLSFRCVAYKYKE